MKIGVSTYSYSRLMGAGKMSVLDVIAKVREMGFESIEFVGFGPMEGETLEQTAGRLKDACDRAGLPIASYTVGADLLKGAVGDQDKEIERLKGEVRIAKILGVPAMRHDAGWGFPAERKVDRAFSDALPILARGCRAVTEFAAGLGIRTMVENHGYFCQDSERVEQLVHDVHHANFGVLLDVGNFLCVDEDPVKAVGRLLPYVFHVHVKDFHVKPGMSPNPGDGWFCSRGGNYLRGSIIGHGDVPVLQCLRLLKNARYDGVLSMEFEGMEDPLTGIGVGRKNLSAYLKQVEG